MVNPDLTVYGRNVYNESFILSDNKSLFTIKGELYGDSSFTQVIGTHVVDGTTSTFDGNTFFNETNTFSLPEGTITSFVAGENKTQPIVGIFNEKQKLVCRIASCSGNFTFSTGYVLVTTLGEQKRIYEFYFDSNIIRAIQN